MEQKGGGAGRGQPVQQAGGGPVCFAFGGTAAFEGFSIAGVDLDPSAAVAQHVETPVPHRRPQPGPDLDRLPQLVEALQRPDQGLLHRVEGVVVAPQVSEGLAVELLLVAPHEGLEGGQVPGSRGPGQGTVAGFCGLHAPMDA